MIYTEKEKCIVVFSTLFVRDYPELYKELAKIMSNYYRGFGEISHTKDYWVRDFMPIQINFDRFVKFTYNPDYLQNSKKYITNVDKVLVHSRITQIIDITNVPIVLDGGNIVFCYGCNKDNRTDFVVMTEKILSENPGISKELIECILKLAFDEPNLTIVWLPWDKQDTFGHSDGIVKYVGITKNGTPKVLVNLELYDDDTAKQMRSALCQHFEVVDLKLSEYDELSWAYINCLQTEKFIIIPGIGNSTTDKEALRQYQQLFPDYKDNIYQVQMQDFIKKHGGALNCLTWTIGPSFRNLLELFCRHKTNFSSSKRQN